MLTAQEVKDRLAAELRAENNDHYRFDRDYKPAINFAIDIVISLVESKLGSNKFSEEGLRFLRYTRVWETSKHSRIALDDTIRTIEAVFPKPTYIGTKSALPSGFVDSDSRLLTEVTFKEGVYGSAQRMNSEEWADQRENPFAPGYALELARPANSYAYRHLEDYGSNADYNPIKSYTYTIANAFSSADTGVVNIVINGVKQSVIVDGLTGIQDVYAAILTLVTDPIDINQPIGLNGYLIITSESGTVYGDITFQDKPTVTFLNTDSFSGSTITIELVGASTYNIASFTPADNAAIVTALNALTVTPDETFVDADPNITIQTTEVFTAMTVDDGRINAVPIDIVEGDISVTKTPAIAGAETGAEQRIEIELRPALSRDVVGISYIKRPEKVTALTDNVEFPDSMLNILVMAGLIWISNKKQNSEQLYKIALDTLGSLIKQF